MGSRKTKLLVALGVASALAAGAAYSWEGGKREAAVAAASDLAVCRAQIADLARWDAGPTGGAPLTADNPELNRRLRDAAAQAGAADELASIDPGPPRQLGETDYSETPVFVRLNTVSLRQLVTFLHHLSSHDAGVRAKSIELAIPAGQTGGDAWTADVTLGYLSYAPRARAAQP